MNDFDFVRVLTTSEVFSDVDGVFSGIPHDDGRGTGHQQCPKRDRVEDTGGKYTDEHLCGTDLHERPGPGFSYGHERERENDDLKVENSNESP